MAEQLIKVEVIKGVVTGNAAATGTETVDAKVGEFLWVREQSLEVLKDKVKRTDGGAHTAAPPFVSAAPPTPPEDTTKAKVAR